MKKTFAAGTGLLAALTLLACSGATEEAAEPSDEPTAAASSAEPRSEQDPGTGVPKDAWLDQARTDHLDDLEEWHSEYVDADCAAHEPQCRDLFAEGLPLMADYSYWIRNQTLDLPEYIPATHSAEVAAATRALVSWSYACPDDDDCEDMASTAESQSAEVVAVTSEWAAQ